jgi:glycogen debranching enzyme
MDEEIIQYKDKHYILSSAYSEDRSRVLKQDETLAVFDRYGDFHPLSTGSQGLFFEGTRYLSRLEMRLEGQRLSVLSSAVVRDNALLTVDLTNPDIFSHGEFRLPRSTVHVFRATFLWKGACYTRVRITHCGIGPLQAALAMRMDADFADIFEIRGTKRAQRGQKRPPQISDRSVILSYLGLDGVERKSVVTFHSMEGLSPEPIYQRPDGEVELRFHLKLDAQSSTLLYWTCQCTPGEKGPDPLSYEAAWSFADKEMRDRRTGECRIETTFAQFNDWIHRSYADVHILTTRQPTGLYPYAGVPWFDTVFGRDGIITALAYLWINPDLARGVLTFLARHQASDINPETDAEPGKILHETRKGEMAALKEIPFYFYYGSIDATPLFIILAGAYIERTGDVSFAETLWPHVEAALDWIKNFGDRDGDGFVEYYRRSSNGLQNQGWKDSNDSIFHKDGSLATGSIALCEVQGYVYDAWIHASKLAALLGKTDRVGVYTKRAEELKTRFTNAFWCEELSLYALALDGDKHPCRVRTSNSGLCLFSGIAHPEHAQRMAEVLLQPDFFSGWGIRTVASTEIRYNPMSYHNGSVWPHDNAMIAAGLARYGYKDQAIKILVGLFNSTLFTELHRLPELFCGFSVREGEGPTSYPVACIPQAWASAAFFMLIQSLLGLSVQNKEMRVYFTQPRLPDFISQLSLRNLSLGSSRADIVLRRHNHDISLEIEHRLGAFDVIVRP